MSVALLGVAVVPVVGTVGGDARWVAALGAAIAHGGGVPVGIPFASATTAGWHDPLVLAALSFHGLYVLGGDRALGFAQMGAVATAFIVLARDARRAGATDSGAALALLCLLVGALPALAIVRLQLFSIALFPLLLALLRAEHRAPSRRIWLAAPLLALWSNLHGGVLVGMTLTLIYLLLDRRRVSGTAAAVVMASSCVAACFLNSALLETPWYFTRLLQNEVAVQHVGLWRHFSFRSPWDLALLGAAVALVVAGRRSRPPGWEVVSMILLAGAAADASRGGVWLLAMLVAPAAAGLSAPPLRRVWFALTTAAVVAAVGASVAWPDAPERGVVEAAVTRAHGRPILAEGSLAEEVAVRGGRIWVGNPLDAFARADQRVYVAWLRGEPLGDRALRHSDLVLVLPRSLAAARIGRVARARLVVSSRGAMLYALSR
ncbi:MAG: hypothetical protein ACJ757_13600 [Gaiellaceae bacterium]